MSRPAGGATRGHAMVAMPRLSNLRLPWRVPVLAAALWLSVAAFVAPAFAQQGLVAVPQLTARVTDLTNTLTPDQSSALEAKLAAFEQAKGSQVAVLIVPTTAARRHRPVFDTGGGPVAARPREGRGRRAAAGGAQRSQAPHRGRLRPRRRAAGRNRQSHHPAGHRTGIQARRLLRRHQHRRRPHHARHRRRAPARAGDQPARGRHPGALQPAAVPVHLRAGRRLDPAQAVRPRRAARSRPAASSVS